MNTKIRHVLPVALTVLVLDASSLAAMSCPECGPHSLTESPADLKESLRQSTVTAIQLEIDAYTAKLQAAEEGTGPAENKAKFRETILALEAERDRLDRMTAEEYPDPVKSKPDPADVLDEATVFGPMVPAELREAVVIVDAPCDVGSLLPAGGASRSGPFYHLAGILRGDAAVLKPGRSYVVTMFLVYRREYVGLIGDYYVYVAGWR